MASKLYRFKGPVRWAKVFEQNRDLEGYMGQAKEYGGEYSVDVQLDQNQLDVLNESGAGKKDKDGWVKFKRKHEGPFAEASGSPRVVKADNTLWDFLDDGVIGNDSVAEITVSIFTTKRGHTGSRLEKVKVLEHKEYEGSGGGGAEVVAYEDNSSSTSSYKEDLEDVPF